MKFYTLIAGLTFYKIKFKKYIMAEFCAGVIIFVLGKNADIIIIMHTYENIFIAVQVSYPGLYTCQFMWQ